MYCVYLTIYRGNLLPPFYIGYTTSIKISNGYHGTVRSKDYQKIWETELRDNPHLFETHILAHYETVEEATDKEIRLQKYTQAHKNPLYINRTIAGLKYHIHNHTEETKLKMSLSKKGRPSHRKGKTLSESHKQKVSLSLIGNQRTLGYKHSEETKLKMSMAAHNRSRS